MNENEVNAFAETFRHFMQAMTASAGGATDSELTKRIREHVGGGADELPVTTGDLAATERPNLQLALDDVLVDAELIGYRARHMRHVSFTLTDLLAGEAMSGPISLGPPEYAEVEVGDGRVIRCVTGGVYLARRDGNPIVLALTRREQMMGGSMIGVELMSPAEGAASALLSDLRAAMARLNVYRGRIVSFHGDPHNEGPSVQFHTLPEVQRDHVILPDGTLERLERHAMGVIDRAELLRAAGRHLKRGILLHGPPGTGKTLTIGYLLSAMGERTTILLTGRGLGFIEQAITMARALAPATVVFEDVDLIASERTMMYGDSGILFTLLNQMEGLADDEDLLFLLTSNRPDLLEPALASRPGRVDLALEVPLPDAEGRRRLCELYLGGAAEDVIERTEGLTGAFIRELARQAALTAALDGRGAHGPDDVRASLDELLADRSALTRRLLGEGGGEEPPPGPDVFSEGW